MPGFTAFKGKVVKDAPVVYVDLSTGAKMTSETHTEGIADPNDVVRAYRIFDATGREVDQGQKQKL